MTDHTLTEMAIDIIAASKTPGKAPASIPEQRGWLELKDSISNYDFEIPHGLDGQLIAGGCHCRYYAWEFSAHVWFEDEQFYAHINRNREHVDTLHAASLRELMTACCDKYGYE